MPKMEYKNQLEAFFGRTHTVFLQDERINNIKIKYAELVPSICITYASV